MKTNHKQRRAKALSAIGVMAEAEAQAAEHDGDHDFAKALREEARRIFIQAIRLDPLKRRAAKEGA